ncbi:MAG: ABC transporter substrate-binding protein [Candidatus Eremiobacteraeota bacterium]|nr:ABC transporter substrate-binding protein [Candidatus Eremiobacteraeota bacterium]
MRRLAILLAIVLATAYTSAAPDARKPLVFRYYNDPTMQVNKDLCQRWEQQNPGYKVVHETLPAMVNTQREKYVTALASGDDSFDCFALDIIWAAEFANAGWILPIDSYTNPERLGEFIPSTLEPLHWKGQLYGLPWSCNVGTFFYRKDLLEAAHRRPPTTWDELVDTGAAIQNSGQVETAFVFQAARYEGLVCDFLEYLWGNDGDVFDSQGQVALQSPQALEALTFMSDLIHRYKLAPAPVVSYQEPDSYVAFSQGAALFHRSWPYVIQLNHGESKLKGKIGMSRIPGHHGLGHGTLGNWNLVINARSKNPEAAYRLIDFLTSAEAQRVYTLESGLNPSLRGLYIDPDVVAERPQLPKFLTLIETGKTRPITPLYPKVSKILQVEIHRALTRETTPQKALSEATWKLEALRKRYPGVPLQ